MPRHYLDHASTTPLRPEAADAIRAWLTSPAGDPGRVHHEGRLVRATVEDAREQVAHFLGVRPRQVLFTSGGTEAAHTAIWGAVWDRPGGAILCAGVEHSAVRDASARSARIVEIAVDGVGRLDPGAVAEALAASPSTALVHCQWANHEVGTVQPVAEVVAASHRAGVLAHVDAAAAAGHVALGLAPDDDAEAVPDLCSVSAHKLGGPPGIGALVLRRGLRIEPLFLGSTQERGRRAGMENVPGIVGFGAAAAALASGGAMAREAAENRQRTDVLTSAVSAIDGTLQIGDPVHRLPHIVCFGVEGVEAEPVLLALDRAGIAAHSGSACSSESLEPSPVLAAMGVDPSHSLRLSTGWSTTDADIDAFAAAFGGVVAELRALRT